MKRSIIIITMTLLAIFFTIPVHSHALNNEEHHEILNDINNEDNHGNIELFNLEITEEEHSILYVPCPGGGKHTMQGRGTGHVSIDGEIVLSFGQTSQCTKCLTVIISEYNPYNPATNKLGYYASQSTNELVGRITYMETDRLYYNSRLTDMDSYTW